MLLPPDLYSDTWVATDGLGRKLPISGEARRPRSDRFVGIFYFVWHGLHGTPGPYDITQILKGEQAFGPVSAFHWWGEPEIGYFRSSDPWVARRNLSLLATAGVDCLFVDATNGFTYDEEMRVLFETAEAMRAQGNPTPQIAFVLNANVLPTVQRLWDVWYGPKKHEALWFRWKGKPLILADREATENGKTIPEKIKESFNWRRSWFETRPRGWFGDGKDRWAWRDRTPQRYGWHEDPTKPEQIAVGVASHPTLNLGRSYAKGKQPETLESVKGIQFQEQWNRALEVDPEMVFVTGWNEWVAQRFTVAQGQRIDFLGKRLNEGETFFVDLYNEEFSRDIDPMKGGYGDDYFYQLIANVRRFKGARPVPKASGAKTIRIEGPFSQWQTVGPEYRDEVGDTMHRDAAGWGDLRYRDDSGRNDIVTAKVARDAKSVFFYVKTQAALTSSKENGWMLLLIDTDRSAATGWHGYDFRVSSGWLEKWIGRWQPVSQVPSRIVGREMQLSVLRKSIGGSFDFKWVDNCGSDGMFLGGDAAPPRRFKYAYRP